MPSYSGPYLAPPEKPQVDPAVLHLVDISKGKVLPAPGWGGGPVTPGGVSIASTGGASSGGPAAQILSLPNPIEEEFTSSGRCLSPAAHKAGQLTYGIYEGGGITTAASPLPRSPVSGKARWRQAKEKQQQEEEEVQQQQQQRRTSVISEEAQEDEEPAAATETLQLRAQDRDVGGAGKDESHRVVATVAGSALPAVNSPRAGAVRAAGAALSGEPASGGWKGVAVPSPRDGGGSGGSGGSSLGGKSSVEDQAKRRREATARIDTEMEVALWIEGTTGETFPGKFWSSLKDGGKRQNVVCFEVPK